MTSGTSAVDGGDILLCDGRELRSERQTVDAFLTSLGDDARDVNERAILLNGPKKDTCCEYSAESLVQISLSVLTTNSNLETSAKQ